MSGYQRAGLAAMLFALLATVLGPTSQGEIFAVFTFLGGAILLVAP